MDSYQVPAATLTRIVSGLYGDESIKSGDDWFVPNLSEFQLYLDVAYGDSSGYVTRYVDWPRDPNGEFTETRQMPVFDFLDGGSNYLLSEILNAGALSEIVDGSILYVYPECLVATYADSSPKWNIDLGNNWKAGPHTGNTYSEWLHPNTAHENR